MINVKFFILLIASTAFVSGLPRPETEIITSPEPGQEYVFVQSSGSGSRPIERKDKNLEQERETAHKIPPSLKYTFNQEDDIIETKPIKGKIHKREANPGEGPAPAPAGAIKLDVRKLLEMYKSDLKTSTTTTTAKPKSTSSASKKRGGNNRRVKKEAKSEDLAIATSPSPVLTTAAAVPRKIDLDDIPLVAAGSEKQRSRIQIKKGPNGQDYEYEYVYYYYDDDEDSKDKVSNSHDGPTRNQISRGDKTRGEKTGEKSRTEKTSTAPEANEVVPSASRQRTRGRQLGEEDGVNEERLPANTRFPPRSRNLNTTPLPEEETKATSRGRGRGRPTTESAIPASENDNVSDETQGSRGRTRANVRRPALELVDSASFNTHSNAAGAEPPSGGPSFPTELPAGPVRFLGATPNERMELPADADDEPKKPVVAPAPVSEPEEESETKITTADGEATTVMSPMDKVALDLYAVVQGTQKLSGEDSEATSDDDSTDSVNTEGTTVEAETEVVETTTPTTTTTTTTTTTPAPTTTTTTTTEAPLGRGGKYRPRPGAGRRTSHASSTTETTPAEPTKKSKFARPGFGGRPRLGAKTTPEPAVEQEATKEESKPVSHSRPTVSRARFGGNRARGRTTAAPAETNEETASSSTAAPSHRPALPRARPSFNLRSRGRTTPAPADSEAAGNEEAHESSPAEASSTTVRSRRISAGNSVRPLRPGPKINLAGRGRGAASSTTPASEEHVTSEETASNVETKPTEEESEPQPPADSTPLKRLQNRNRLNVQQRPKAAASAPVQVRRVNPLLGRRRPGQTTEASSSEAPQEAPVTEEAQADEKAETEVPASSSTTEEPKGINKLLAGRRRLTNRQPEPTEKTATVTSTATNLPPSDSVTTDVPERLRPSNRRRIHTPSTEDPIEENLDKSETISIQTKSNVHRSRFHDRTKTLSETSDETDIPKVEPQSIHAPFSRKPSFTSRTRSTTTSIPLNKNEEISQNINTTTPKLIGLRPGPKINFKPRTRRPSLPIVTEHSTEKSVENVEEEESTTTETTSSTKIHTRSRRPYAGRRRSDRVTTTEATEEKSMDKETTTDIVNDRSTTKKETGLTKLFAIRRLSVQTA